MDRCIRTKKWIGVYEPRNGRISNRKQIYTVVLNGNCLDKGILYFRLLNYK